MWTERSNLCRAYRVWTVQSIGGYDRSMAMSEQRREALVRTAAEEFAAAGYDQASLNDVIRRCGLSKSSFYHVLSSKRELYDLVVSDATQAFAATLALPAPEEFSGPQYWDRIVDLIVRMTQVLTSDDLFVDLGHILYDAQAPEDSAAQQAVDAAEEWICRLVMVGRDCGAVRDDLPASLQGRLAFTTLKTFDEWSVRNLEAIPTDQMASLVDAQLATLRRMFAVSD